MVTGHFTKTFVSQHVVWIHSSEPMMRNCMQRKKIAELVLGAPRETAEMANPHRPVRTPGLQIAKKARAANENGFPFPFPPHAPRMARSESTGFQRQTRFCRQSVTNEHIPLGTAGLPSIVLVLDAERQIQDLNPAAEQFLAANRSEVLQKSADHILGAKGGLDQILLRLGKNHLLGHVELRLPLHPAEGTAANCDLVIIHLRSDGGGYVLGIRDPEEFERLEERRLQQINIESLRQLAAGLAHDLNNLLGGIQGYSDLLKLQRLTGKASSYVDRIHGTVGRAAEILRQLLVFARTGPFSPSLCNLPQLVTQATQDLALPNAWKVSVYTTISDHRIIADPALIVMALKHLIKNAYESMPSGGEIIVRIHDLDHEEPGLDSATHYVEISIQDHGVGIPEALRPRIFDPFFTTKDVGAGSGLGLAAAHGVAAMHKGTIRCTSVEGEGSTFRFLLARTHTSGTSSIIRRNDDNDDSRPPAVGRILIIDDEEIVRDSLSAMLARLGYGSISAASGTDGIKLFAAEQTSIDLIILDVQLPDLKGGEVLNRLRSLDRHIPIIVVTGYSTPDTLILLKKQGLQGLLQKPISMEALRTAVDTALDEA
jgi:signal transduction histidine kinase